MTQQKQDEITPAWLELAFTQHGVREVPGPRAHPQIAAYHATTSLSASSDEVPWCSSFVNWCITRSRLAGTNSAAARSWLDWGVPLQVPRLGCVVIFRSFRRGPQAGHVAFYWMDRDLHEVWCYGGNHGNSVGLKSYPRADILGFRWPSELKQPT